MIEIGKLKFVFFFVLLVSCNATKNFQFSPSTVYLVKEKNGKSVILDSVFMIVPSAYIITRKSEFVSITKLVGTQIAYRASVFKVIDNRIEKQETLWVASDVHTDNSTGRLDWINEVFLLSNSCDGKEYSFKNFDELATFIKDAKCDKMGYTSKRN